MVPIAVLGCMGAATPKTSYDTAVYAEESFAKHAMMSQVELNSFNGGDNNSESNYHSGGYPSFYAYETHTHSIYQKMGTIEPTVNSRGYYHDTGIKFYGSNTSSSVGSTGDIKLNQSCPYIDFSDVHISYPSNVMDLDEFKAVMGSSFTAKDGAVLPIVSDYKLEIYSGSSRRWYAEVSIDDLTSDNIVVTVNKNGSKSTKTGLNYADPTLLGKLSTNLYSGSYTIKFTLQYYWFYVESTNINTWCIMKSTATSSGTLLIDTTKPSLSMKNLTKTLSNGSYSTSQVTVTASDSNYSRLYYKRPGYTSYSSTTSTSYTTPTTAGWYYFYAEDKAGNITDTYSVYVDTVKPTGSLYANGSAVSSGSYTSKSFSYVASDSASGIANCYYRTPNSSSFVGYASGSIVPNTSGDGWYYFYSVDKAGNQSETVSIYLETAAPEISILRNGKKVYSDSLTGNESIDTGLYFNEGDTVQFIYSSKSGVCTDGIFDVGTVYTLSSGSYPNDEYTETITSATGITVNYAFKIVRDKPYITINGKNYQNGSVVRLAEDSQITMNYDSVITDGNVTGTVGGNTYNLFKSNKITLKGEEGRTKSYDISVNDAAGNVSTFTVIIDKEPSQGSFTYNGELFESGSYINHPVAFEFSESGTTATISKDGGTQNTYLSDTEITGDGIYTIVLTDNVGNTSEYRITIDTVKPVGNIYADGKETSDGTVTDKAIYFTWNDDATCLVNGNPYTRNAVIDEEGSYTFILKDKAGNENTYHAEIDRTAPSANADYLSDRTNDNMAVTRWYDVRFNGEIRSFINYEDALEYAVSIEKKNFLKELTLTNISDFTETGLVASNGDPDSTLDDVREGTYWLYKSKANSEVRLYYFDADFLEEVIRSYAKSYVSDVRYSDGVSYPSEGEVYNSLWTMNGENLPIGNNYVLRSDSDVVSAVAQKDSDENIITLNRTDALGLQLAESGIYTITEIDLAGNSVSYRVIIDHENPSLEVSMTTYDTETPSWNLNDESMPNSKTFYAKTFSFENIISGDSYSVLEIKKNGETLRYLADDTLPVLTEGGLYEIRLWDRLGHEIDFNIYISDKEEVVSFTNNNDNTEVNIRIDLPETYEALTSVEIYRNDVKLDGVSTDIVNYTFDKDGVYRVIIKDNFGRTIEKVYDFDKALPEGTISGVENGGKTASDVTFTYDASKYYAEVYKDGNLCATDMSGAVDITADKETSGYYEIKLINLTDEENVNFYKFEIDCIEPTVTLDGVEDKMTTNGSVTVSWNDTDVETAVVIYNGEETAFENGEVFTKEGAYEIRVIDDMGNVTIKSFTIDKTVDYVVTTSDGRTISGDATTSDDVVVTADEEAIVTVIKDGENYPYEFGDTLSEEGKYLITVTDAYGNKNSFTVVIDKTVDVDINICDGGITNDSVVIKSGEKTTVTVTKDGSPYDYSLGDEISEEGTYRVVITDAYGNQKTLEFQIVSSDPKTSLDYVIGDVEITSVTHDGEEIPFEGNVIHFTEDGEYVITYMKNGVEYSFTLNLDTTAPEITLNGVEDGGSVDGTVTITDMNEEGTVTVYKDGEEIAYDLGDELKDYGHYKVVVTDALGNMRTYEFDLAFRMNGWAIALIAVGVLSLAGLVVGIVIKRRKVFRK